MNGIDFKKWDALVTTDPQWYIKCLEHMNIAAQGNLIGYWQKNKETFYDFFEKHIKSNDLVLGDVLIDWDGERKNIDTIIIHHAQVPSPVSQERLSAITLVRLYVKYFANPTDPKESLIKGKPIFSGHVRDGKQVFWPYHWLVRADGSVERLLNDNEVGWQAGNWDMNCRSVAITFDNDYENATPSEAELNAAAKIIKEHYPSIAKERILGHREVNLTTTCPSNLFLDTEGKKGWKNDLLKKI